MGEGRRPGIRVHRSMPYMEGRSQLDRGGVGLDAWEARRNGFAQMKNRISLTAMFFALCLPGTALAAPSLEFNVQTHQLTNGMKLLLLEDHGIPNVRCTFFTGWGLATSVRASPAFPTFLST